MPAPDEYKLSISNKESGTYNRYNKVFYSMFFTVLLLVIILNTYLSYIENFNNNPEWDAALWQEETGGIACTNERTNRKFKMYRLQKMLGAKQINTLAIGSSTLMSLRDCMVPLSQKFYNFAQNSLSSLAVFAELEGFCENNTLCQFIIGIDIYNGLALGFFAGQEISLQNKQKDKKKKIKLSLIKDAITASKVKLLFHKVWIVLSAPNMKEAFLRVFHPFNHLPYKCPDGSLAQDFSTPYPGVGAGFRRDGSATFANLAPLTHLPQKENMQRIKNVLNMQLSTIKSYDRQCSLQLFDELSGIVRRIKERKAQIFFILPPILPHLEQAFLKTQEAAIILKLKRLLHEWALKEDVIILDASRSEAFGCTETEFVDAFHALPPCYSKIIKKFYMKKDQIRSGLISSIDLE